MGLRVNFISFMMVKMVVIRQSRQRRIYAIHRQPKLGKFVICLSAEECLFKKRVNHKI